MAENSPKWQKIQAYSSLRAEIFVFSSLPEQRPALSTHWTDKTPVACGSISSRFQGGHLETCLGISCQWVSDALELLTQLFLLLPPNFMWKLLASHITSPSGISARCFLLRQPGRTYGALWLFLEAVRDPLKAEWVSPVCLILSFNPIIGMSAMFPFYGWANKGLQKFSYGLRIPCE